MYKRILTLVIVGSLSLAYADSAVQTDWSAGDRGLYAGNSVLEWTNYFNSCININWRSAPGEIVLHFPVEFVLADDFRTTCYIIYSDDIDGDGDMDILCVADHIDGSVAWWENTDGSGSLWVEHIISDNFQFATSVHSLDIDGDGDMDILGSAHRSIKWWENRDKWWENTDSLGTSWIEYTISDEFDWCSSVFSEDIDGDGDMDVIGAARTNDDIIWWENDGSDSTWIEHIVDGDFNGAVCVYSEDIDGDGDMDILGAAQFANDITWWENVDGFGDSWIAHIINEDFSSVRSVYSVDIDGDGDMDVLGAARDDDRIAWLENIDGSGTVWKQHTIDENFAEPNSVYSEDMDGDGDMDVLGASSDYYDCFAWWENIDGSGSCWIKHLVQSSSTYGRCVYAEDVNGDGNMDILGAAVLSFGWFDLTRYYAKGVLESSLHVTEVYPKWGEIDWNARTPPGTSISFQVRLLDSPNSSTWSHTLTSPCSLRGILDDGYKYIQYRAILETSNTGISPTLYDVTITWDSLTTDEIYEIYPWME